MKLVGKFRRLALVVNDYRSAAACKPVTDG